MRKNLRGCHHACVSCPRASTAVTIRFQVSQSAGFCTASSVGRQRRTRQDPHRGAVPDVSRQSSAADPAGRAAPFKKHPAREARGAPRQGCRNSLHPCDVVQTCGTISCRGVTNVGMLAVHPARRSGAPPGCGRALARAPGGVGASLTGSLRSARLPATFWHRSAVHIRTICTCVAAEERSSATMFSEPGALERADLVDAALREAVGGLVGGDAFFARELVELLERVVDLSGFPL